ncbi:hypothetical protein D3C87_395880 [compost metagenome]
MAKIEKFEDLQVWILAREISQAIWLLFENTSLGKDFELKNQMSRSSGSIMDNIAEGFERNGNREFIQFLSISKGSCGELRYQLYRAFDRNHITKEQFEEIASKTDFENKKLGFFISYLNSSEYRGSKFSRTSTNSKP